MTDYKQDAYCSYCGRPFEEAAAWPRRCAGCEKISFKNPLPVAIVLLPVGNGILVGRRGMDPRRGLLALPGGYMELNETWQEAAARELLEETEVAINPYSLTLFDVRTGANMILIFGLAPGMDSAELPPFTPTEEIVDRVVINQPVEMAFPLHTEALVRFFNRS